MDAVSEPGTKYRKTGISEFPIIGERGTSRVDTISRQTQWQTKMLYRRKIFSEWFVNGFLR